MEIKKINKTKSYLKKKKIKLINFLAEFIKKKRGLCLKISNERVEIITYHRDIKKKKTIL